MSNFSKGLHFKLGSSVVEIRLHSIINTIEKRRKKKITLSFIRLLRKHGSNELMKIRIFLTHNFTPKSKLYSRFNNTGS